MIGRSSVPNPKVTFRIALMIKESFYEHNLCSKSTNNSLLLWISLFNFNYQVSGKIYRILELMSKIFKMFYFFNSDIINSNHNDVAIHRRVSYH